jgi:DNA uptake protein ComE-like DNA-binding protein
LKDKKSFLANLGLTLKEAKALLFLSFFFIVSILTYFFFNNNNEKKAFDYRIQDSAFYNKKITKAKLTKSKKTKKDKLPPKPVNLLKANISELTAIDGISKSKAEKIILLRNQGKLNNCIDIVKAGIISREKFEDIRDYIFIE